MKKIRMIGILLAATLLVAGCGGSKKADIRLGTGGVGGNYYSYGTNLAGYLDSEADVSAEVRSTAGSAANLRLIAGGYLDMALVQSDTMADALAGTGLFQDEALSGFHAVTGLYTESIQLVTGKNSGIASVEDLVGKKVSLGEKDSGVVSNANQILNAYAIGTNAFEAKYMSFADSAESLLNGEIDAFFCTASAPTTAIVELAQKTGIRLVPISAEVTRGMLGENSPYVTSIIPAGTYEGQTEDVSTLGVSAVLIAADNLSTETENAVLAVLKAHNDELQEVSFGVAVKEEESGMLTVSVNMYMTLALAVAVLYVGKYLRKKVNMLEKFCIPAPVIGGIIFAVLSCVLYETGIAEFVFDETLKNVCMIIFFTSVGFQANLKVLKKGGFSLVVFLGLVIVLIVAQNGMALGLSKVLNVDPLVGLCTGSIPMVGGHGTSGAFGLVLEDLGLEGATTLCTAAATFGLILGSLMGGPIGRRLIEKRKLLDTIVEEDTSILEEDEMHHRRSVSMYAPAAYQLAIAMGIGTIVSTLLSETGMTFPIYIGAMIVAAFMRNVGEFSKKYTVHMGEINDIGGICLSLFLGIAMVTLKLWQLASLALPLFLLLLAQTILMAVFAYFVVYNLMGRDYDAAILSAGTCGFGMGATPNAMANMQALTDKYAPSVKAYLLVPIVGSMFADFINSLVITFFINLI